MACFTGVGSLPHTSTGEAMEVVAEYSPAIPFWPQLPTCGPNMLEEALADVPELARASPWTWTLPEDENRVLDRLLAGGEHQFRETAPGFRAFVDRLRAGGFAGATALKGQLCGPFTLASALRRVTGETLWSHPQRDRWLEGLLGLVAGRLRAQSEALGISGKPVWLWLDDPAISDCAGFLSYSLLEKFQSQVDAASGQNGARLGIHCCARVPWELLRRLRVPLVSFDALRYGVESVSDPAAAAYVREGGRLAFGIVPTDERLAAADPLSLALSVRALAGRLGYSLEPVITSTCGLGLLTPEAARRSLELAAAVAEEL